MRRDIVVLTVASFLAALTVAAQSPDALLGAWKLNVEKSTISPGPPPKSDVSTWEALGGGEFKLTENIVEADVHPNARSGSERSIYTGTICGMSMRPGSLRMAWCSHKCRRFSDTLRF